MRAIYAADIQRSAASLACRSGGAGLVAGRGGRRRGGRGGDAGAEVLDDQGRQVRVTGRGTITAPPANAVHNVIIRNLVFTGTPEEFQKHLNQIAPGVTMHVMQPGDDLPS